jgi:hypothetical protein
MAGRRRAALVAALAAAAVALGACGGSPAPAAPSVSATKPTMPPIPSSPGSTLFGASVDTDRTSDFSERLAQADGQFGGLRIVRVYLPMSDTLPGWSDPRLAVDAPIVVSFKDNPLRIRSGLRDVELRAWFAAAPKDRDVYWSFYHEPEDNADDGEFLASDYVLAWQHLAAIARSVHNPRLHSTLILSAWSLNPASNRTWKDYYPGSDAVDLLAWDVPNTGLRKGVYTDPATLFDPVIAASKSVGRPWGVAEWGSPLVPGDDGSDRAAWLVQVSNFLQRQGAAFALWFNSDVGGDARLRDAPSIAAFRAIVDRG